MKKVEIKKILNRNKNLIIEKSDILNDILSEKIKRNESFLMSDTSYICIDKHYEELKNKGYNTIIINLKDTMHSEGYNPLSYPYRLFKNNKEDEAIECLEDILKIIFKDNDKRKKDDPFWDEVSIDLILGIILGLFEDAAEDEINFSSVNEILLGLLGESYLGSYFIKYFNGKTSSTAYKCAAPVIMASNDTKSSIFCVSRQRLLKYNLKKNIRYLLNKTTFDLENILKEKTAIFVITKENDKNINDIAAMLISQVYKFIYDENFDNRFNFILGNIDAIDYINDLETILFSALDKNIKFYIETLSLENMKEKYSALIFDICEVIKKVDSKSITNINSNHDISKYPNLDNKEPKKFNIRQFVDKKTDLLFDNATKLLNDEIFNIKKS